MVGVSRLEGGWGMTGFNIHETIFVVSAVTFQIILIIHFGLRRWRFDLAMKFGPIVYAMSIPAAASSIYQLYSNESWYIWIGGFIYLIWAVFGYYVDYVRKINWRTRLDWPVLGPYITLYLATVMFFWWPLALVSKPHWYVCALLFLVSTFLNITSHRKRNLILKENQI